jgi:hypothetical protein
VKYRIELSSFRSHRTVMDALANRSDGEIRWSAQVIDSKGREIAVDNDWGLGYAFGDTKEEALLNLRIKLAKHEAAVKEVEELNIRMGEVVEIEL